MRPSLTSAVVLLYKDLARVLDEIAKEDKLHRDQLRLLKELYDHANERGRAAWLCLQ
jgi:hypothetical protein